MAHATCAQSRHERVCAKNQKMGKKRPVFDTSKKRMEGTDLQSFLASRPHLKSNKPSTAEIVSFVVTAGGSNRVYASPLRFQVVQRRPPDDLVYHTIAYIVHAYTLNVHVHVHDTCTCDT